MKTKNTILMTLFLGMAIASIAQVKIGNNPNTINANSLLELESTNQGFLAPRMALGNVNTVAPLIGTVPAGMLIYSSGGSVTDGFYVWNGSKWLSITTSANGKTNFVLVKSTADLPAPVGGIITLVAGTLYEINGTITLSNKIDLNGCKITGSDGQNDKLVYTGASELFTGVNTGTLMFLTLSTPSGNLFNINAAGANKNFLMENCNIIGCSSIGTIQNVGGKVFFSDVIYFSNTNGITFNSDSIVAVYSNFWDVSNHNTYETFTGKFNIIQLLGGGRNVSLANTATGINVSGITSIANGSLKMLLYGGTGTYTTGTFSNNWEVESIGINTQKDDEATGNVYMTTATATPFTAVNAPTKIVGTTTATNLYRVTAPTNNRLTYTGRKVQSFTITCAISFSGINNKNFSFYICKNGVKLPESVMYTKMNSNGDQQALPLTCTVSLSPYDYIEVYSENNTDNSSMTVQTMNLTMK